MAKNVVPESYFDINVMVKRKEGRDLDKKKKKFNNKWEYKRKTELIGNTWTILSFKEGTYRLTMLKLYMYFINTKTKPKYVYD